MTVKKIKNQSAQTGSNTVGEEIKPVASARRYEEFLHEFSHATVGETDEDGEENGSFLIGCIVVDILLSVAPKSKEGKDGIHKNMYHLVEAYGGLDMGKTRTRKSC